MADRDIRWKRRRVARRRVPSHTRQLAGDALAGAFVGLVIVLGIALLWRP